MRYLVMTMSFLVLCIAGYVVALHQFELFGEPPAPIRDMMMMLVGTGSLAMAIAIANLPMRQGSQHNHPTS